MKETLQITLLGKSDIRLDNIPLGKFRYKKTLALLAYLAVTGKAHSREFLAGLLWGESTDANARASLRKSLAELREKLGEYLLIEHQQIAFNSKAAYNLDIEDFQTSINAFKEEKMEGLHLTEAAELARTLSLYRGDFLSGFYIRKSIIFEEWVTLKRESCHLAAIRGLHMLANHYLIQGQYPQAIAQVEKILELAPTQEEAHRQMMSLLALDGRRDAALRQYKSCVHILQKSLGISPQPETTALYHRISEQETQPKKRHISAPLMPLIGRQDELDRIKTLLDDPSCRLLTILGAGGSGKTHLALSLGALMNTPAAQAGDGAPFKDGVSFVPLHAIPSLDALPSAIMHHFGFHFDKESPPIQQLQEQLADQEKLIILDNFEHLLASPKIEETSEVFKTSVALSLKILPELLQNVPKLKILVTSRIRLNIQGEYILPLKGIKTPPKDDDISASTENYPATELFIQRAMQIDPLFNANPDAKAAIAKICQLVNGLPLGILLAAGWSGLLSPDEILERLNTDQNPLPSNGAETSPSPIFGKARRGGDLPDRQRSLRAVFNYSWKLLNVQEQETLAALAIFPDTFDLNAAQEIGSEELNDIRTLIDHSLVQRDISGRCQLHDLTRQYARQKITDPNALLTRYCAYYAHKLSQWGEAIRGEGQILAIAALDLEIDNARQAWSWAIKEGNIKHINQSIDGLCLYYDWHSRYPEGYAACEELIQHLDNAESLPNEQNPAEIKHVLAKTLVWQSFFAPSKENESLLRRALAYLNNPITKEIDTRTERAFCLLRLAKKPSLSNDQIEAQEMLAQSIKLYKETGDRWGEANALTTLGELLWGLSSYKESEKILKRSLAIYQELGDKRGIATAMVHLGSALLFYEEGQLEGERLLRESMALYAEVGNKISMSEGFDLAISAMFILL